MVKQTCINNHTILIFVLIWIDYIDIFCKTAPKDRKSLIIRFGHDSCSGLNLFYLLFSCFLWTLTDTWQRKKIWLWSLPIFQACWLAVALNPGAILHQSPKTVCLHLCMNVRSFRARLLEGLCGNSVSQFDFHKT